MKTTKVHHKFFPLGKGLAINWSNDLVLFYALGNQFTVWATGIDMPTTPDNLRNILDMAIVHDGTEGTSQAGPIDELLSDMPNEVLGDIYSAIVGYDPFIEDGKGAWSLVCEYMQMPEALLEVFGVETKAN